MTCWTCPRWSTGLGLPLARRLAEILGGVLSVQSAPGQGSTFTVTIPRVHPEVKEMAGLHERAQNLDPQRAPVLVLEDDRQTLFLYEKYLERSGFQVLPVRSVEDARRSVQRVRPAAMVLDVMLEGETSWNFLAEMKTRPDTRDIPILVVTVTDREQKARALGADEFWLKPVEASQLLRKLGELAHRGPVERILIIDDDDVHRYLLKQMLKDTPYVLIEAARGREGIRLAREKAPHLIFLDFVLTDMTAFDVLDELKADPRTRDIPVILQTSHELKEAERTRLARETAAILAKYTDAGGTIFVHASQEGVDGAARAVVRIKDTGIGIPAHKQGSIFELFTQADESLERSRGGLGIGLTLVRSLVELHGGTASVTSAGQGQGSEFLVRLPLAASAPALVGDTLSAEERQRQRRILLVEDNSDARQALKDLLELWGHQVQVAQDGLDGVAMALEVRPELALVDIGLPGLDGYHMARELRARVGEDIRLVAITGYGGPEDRHRALQAGFDHHLVKPVKPDELDRLLTEL